ncbi:hypothetical protein UFOVP71_332 [uncultured Caudovirales phage]|uniref:Uncharacterized protein n=1 Tax=uncultured Caudovirales phage TaxID=2100421 RepID=A0A6J5TBV2_9CAUD|nr:hypothetical protein UFOVP71_332 [uncultured Caudovirales phage]
MSFPYLIQGKNIVVVIGNNSHTVSATHISYEKLKEAIKTGDWDTVQDLIEPKKVVLSYGQGNVEVQGDKLFWKGRAFHNYLAAKFIEMYQEGFPVEPMVNFMENLMLNPSKRAVEELYSFLEKGNLPITADGCFLAYKKIRNDYLDIHSGTMSNAVGNVVEMERNEVDDDKDRTCSSGLHFCSLDYLSHFGGSDSRTVVLKINPRDVVSIPADYHSTKGRACRYEVIDEINKDAADAFIAPVQETAVVSGVTADVIKAAVEAAVKAVMAVKAQADTEPAGDNI